MGEKMGLFSKLFGTYSERQLKKLEPTVNKIEALASTYKAMSDDELSGMTAKFKARLAGGETLDNILPDAFAAVREAADRVLGKRPFRVQLIGGIVLHQGRIAEMKTGEGKTLVAVLPAYLNALAGNGVHIVTVNEYLARVGCEEMGRVYSFMGLTVGLNRRDMTPDEKREAYACDITYVTNSELGFDYLRDNRALYKEHKVQRGHAFAIVDEVDSILIDEARTPLVISGEGEESTDLYQKVRKFIKTLKEYRIKELNNRIIDEDMESRFDYTVDEKARSCVLTASGVKKAEAHFGINNLSDPENALLTHHINQAIKAQALMHRDDNYIVQNGKVIIVDQFTGRLMPGRRYNDGLHQAIEAKENVDIQKESQTLATITYQNFFRLYKKLSGMTGTALTEEDEFREIYALDVVEIPTNMPMIRIDRPDKVYGSVDVKYRAICEQIKECHDKGQPVLVGTVSVDKSELLSKMLKKLGIPHNVLNAKQNDKEAEIVALAGTLGAVTIATNMAGRGTDIMLGGNAEHDAKKEMRDMRNPETGEPLYDEDTVALAVGSSVSVSDEVLAARAVYKEIYEKHKNRIQPLADKVKQLGGLFIVGTERHESRRIDNQLRGRAGRQGDPGESRFFLSLEDDMMRIFGNERTMEMFKRIPLGEEVIESKLLSGFIERAQKQFEGRNFSRRKTVIEYDDIMNEQRKVIYKQRDDVLDGIDLSETILNMMRSTISANVAEYLPEDEPEMWKLDELRNKFLGFLCSPVDFKYTDGQLEKIDPDDIKNELNNRAARYFEGKRKLFGGEFQEMLRAVLLGTVDKKWIEHLDAMDDLKDSIRLQAYAQRNPVSEFRIIGADMFDEMIDEIKEEVTRKVLCVFPGSAVKRMQVAKITGTNLPNDGTAEKRKPIVNTAGGQSLNSLCACGSGLKFKRCCGKNLHRG